jgi:glyoxylase-like metal-dependent hydrolase (beta-lactamase superfamily II)
MMEPEQRRMDDIDVRAVSDGTFLARPAYFGAEEDGSHAELFDRHGAAWLPIGCFVVNSGDRIVLVDAGLGPDRQELPNDMYLMGGQLLTGLRSLGVSRSEITDVVCTHLHADHVGWLFDLNAGPVFGAASIWFGAPDWDHFVTGSGEMADHIREGLLTHSSRLHAIDQTATIAPGMTAALTPGHTPGHLCVAARSIGRSRLLLGDAITCPVQLTEPSWHSFGDVDPLLADRTRNDLWDQLRDPQTVGVGAHFPELRAGHVSADAPDRWVYERRARPERSLS